MESNGLYKYIEDYERRQMKKVIVRKRELSPLLFYAIFTLVIAYISVVFGALFARSSFENILRVLGNADTLKSIKVTLFSIFCSTAITVIIGIPTAFTIALKEGKIYKVLNIILLIPIVLPPSIAGLGLLMSFGRNGFIGLVLKKMNISVPFTITAVIMAQVFVSTPFFIQTLKNGFENIDRQIREAAFICGAGYKELLFDIYLPISKRAIMSGLIMSVLRALGEFGATMMFAGNVAGKTQTVPTLIYTFAQHSSMEAVAMAVIYIMLFIIPLTTVYVVYSGKVGE